MSRRPAHRDRVGSAHPGGFRADVEGMRAVAILAVLLYHAGVGAVGGGYVGVDVFFVLSGFLITGLLWRELQGTGRVSLASFYARRIRRLLPAAVLVLIVTVAAASQWLSPLRAQVVTKDAVAAALYVANYRFAAQRTDYLDADAPPSPLQHYWSLGVEEQFYLFWPLLLVVVSLAWGWSRTRRGERSPRPAPRVCAGVGALALVAAASCALSVRLTGVSQPWAFFSLPTRAWELAAGGLVALGAGGMRRLSARLAAVVGWAGLATVVWSVVRLGGATPFPGTAALAPVGGTAAVLAAGCAAPRLGPGVVLARRPLQVVGRLSYCWYLWHWPVIVLAPAVVGHPFALWQNLALTAGSGLLALATASFVELPVRFSPGLRARPRRSLALGAALTLAATATPVITEDTLLGRLQGHGVAAAPVPRPAGAGRPGDGTRTAISEAARLSALDAPYVDTVSRAAGVRDVPSNPRPSLYRAHADKATPFLDGCNDGFTDSSLGHCAYGSATSRATVMAFGDSHAAHWFPALAEAARTRGWRLLSLTKSTCPPLVLDIWSPDLGRPFRECVSWREAVLARIRSERPAVVVLGFARHYGPEYHFHVFGPEWISGLREMVRRIHATGARVIVLGPTPHPKEDVPDCLAQDLGAATCAQPRTQAVSVPGIRAERAAVQGAGGGYVDVTSWICGRGPVCPVVVGNLLVYRDDNHITTPFAAWLTPLLVARLAEVVPPAGRPRA